MDRFQEKKIALGSEAVLTLVGDNPVQAHAILKELWQKIDQFEQRFSRFLTTSELTKINKRAGQKIKISEPMAMILRASKKISSETGGIFNPFILPNLVRAGYDRSWTNQLPVPQLDASQLVSADEININGNTLTIPTQSALDLGGIGKGYLLDQLVTFTAPKFPNFWFSLGGDIIAGGHDLLGQPWQIGIASTQSPNITIAKVTIPAGQTLSVATSGVGKRRGTHDGRDWHHIIDPRTGQSAHSDIESVTICAPTGLQADVLASCAVILGSQLAPEFLNKNKIGSYLIQSKLSNNSSDRIQTMGDLISINE
jgi:thiamine biosynthesis lipoprotein